MKKSYALLALMGLLLVGCKGGETDGSAASGNKADSVTKADSASKGGNTEKTKVNVYRPSPAGLQKKYEADFEAKYKDIDRVVTSGTTGELLAKIEAEKANPVCDVLVLASWSDGISNLNKLNLREYVPEGSDKLYAEFQHSSHKIWGTSASAVGVLYNTDLVDKAKIEQLDWADFADKDKVNGVLKTEGDARISIPDPTKSGACKDFLAGYVCSKGEEAAWKDLDGWAANGRINGGGNKPALQSVESGDVDILVGGVDYNAYSDKSTGKAVDIYYPNGGTVVNARPARIRGTTQHADAAKKVRDYLCSESAQKLVSDAYLLPGSTKVAAKSDRLGRDDITQLTNLNWDTMAANGTEIATKFVSKLNKSSK